MATVIAALLIKAICRFSEPVSVTAACCSGVCGLVPVMALTVGSSGVRAGPGVCLRTANWPPITVGDCRPGSALIVQRSLSVRIGGPDGLIGGRTTFPPPCRAAKPIRSTSVFS